MSKMGTTALEGLGDYRVYEMLSGQCQASESSMPNAAFAMMMKMMMRKMMMM